MLYYHKPSFWQRLKTAIASAWQSYQRTALIPDDPVNWDDWESRLFRYRHYLAYELNIVYGTLVAYSNAQKSATKLYKHIRPIYNPVSRLTKLYKALVYGGTLDMEQGEQGAIPLVADEPVRMAILQIWRWSNWQAYKSLFVHNGSVYGDSLLKVVDDPVQEQVRLEVLPPGYLVDAKFDAVGNIEEAMIAYTYEGDDGKTHVYSELITLDEIITYRDGEEYAFLVDELGQEISRWVNPYPFVPLVLCKHQDVGHHFGAAPFATVLSKVDEINDQASLINDQIRKTINPMYWASNVGGPAQLTFSDLAKDAVPMIYAPEGSSATPLVFPLDIAGSLQNLEGMLREIENDLPELTLSRIKDLSSPPSGTALRMMFQEGARRVEDATANYNAALIRAQMMALYIGKAQSYEGFVGLEEIDIDLPNHHIRQRPLFPDTLSKQERIGYLQSLGDDRRVMEELEIPDDEIERFLLAKEQRQQQEFRAAGERIFGGLLPNDTGSQQSTMGQNNPVSR